jgi:hypothetical protein
MPIDIRIHIDLTERQKKIMRAAVVGGTVIAALGIGIAIAAPIDTTWIQDGGVLSASSLSTDLDGLQTQITALQSQVTGSWTTFTPTVTSDGTPASVQLFNFAYAQVGKTVFIRGVVVVGYTAAGAGGTFTKISLPVPGAMGVQQDGVGVVVSNYVNGAPGSLYGGWGRIVAGDEGNVLLVNSTGNVTNGYATLNHDFQWVVDGAYQSN